MAAAGGGNVTWASQLTQTLHSNDYLADIGAQVTFTRLLGRWQNYPVASAGVLVWLRVRRSRWPGALHCDRYIQHHPRSEDDHQRQRETRLATSHPLRHITRR